MQQPVAPASAETKAPSALDDVRSHALPPEHLAPYMTKNNHNPSATWGLKAVAAAVLLAASFTAQEAYALSLGRALVQSNLGEPLRAQIDIPSITAQELNSLQVQVGSQEAFRAASMGYSPLLTSVALAVERGADGRYRIVLTSSRVVDEPFLDLVIEANWDSGRLTRTYTMLFDPPNLRAATPAPLLPSGSSVAVPVPVRPAPPAPAAVRPAPSPSPAPASLPSAAPPAARPAVPPAAPRPAAAEPARSVNVQRGDTAGAIALANRPAGVSLDQMLVAMLRGNPDAFMDNNVNRMKAGVVLDMPDEAAASQVSASEARQIIAAQSRDFNDYRRRLAGLAPLQETPEAGRAAAGTVQAEVADAREAAPTPDRLTLSQGAVQSGGEEARIAAERAQAEAGTRVAELSRNLEELNRLSETAPAVPADGAAPPATAGAADAATPGVAIPGAATPADAVVAPAPTPSSEPPPAPTAPPAPPVPAAAPAEDATAFMRDLMANPLALPVGGGVLALLLVLALVRARRNKAATGHALDDAQNEPYADASAAGESVDTSQDAGGPPSSMMYSPSQLDAAGDVDPVAEADVYLAYGRDKQAEEILQDALRSQPTRLAVHMKLLEIYSNRKDPRAYAATAAEVLKLTSAVGADWEQAREWGMALDPTNALYQPNDTVVTMPPLEEAESAGSLPEIPSPDSGHSGLDFDLPETSAPEAPVAKASQDGYDFDLDLTQGAPLAEESNPPSPATLGAAGSTGAVSAAPDTLAGGLDFDIDSTMTEDLTPEPEPAPPAGAAALSRPAADMDFDLDLSEIAEPAADIPATPTPPADAPVAKPLDFDGISLDLDTPPDLQDAVIEDAGELPSTDFGPSTQDFDKADAGLDSLDDLSDLEAAEGSDGSNPLETKLSLAEEFDAIGDTEGARSLAEEVLAEASGDLAERARAFIARLS